MLFELTNEQRRCFAISETEKDWKLITLSPNRFDTYDTYAYITPECRIKKVICVGEDTYFEYGLDEKCSIDKTKTMILPKTDKGKPVKLTVASVMKKPYVGMSITFCRNNVSVVNQTAQREYYNSVYSGEGPMSLPEFENWVKTWCRETTAENLKDVTTFANVKKAHIKYKEADYFRYRINRRLWGYGRILLDFGQMRKNKIPFWDIFAGVPLCVAVYHIVSEKPDVSVYDLRGLPTLPPQMIMDNAFYYGEYEIIGGEPVCLDDFDLPVHYGKSIAINDNRLMYQCGKTFFSLDNADEIERGYRHNGIGFNLHVSLPVLVSCIKEKSNQPYWDQNMPYTYEDLRNPRNKELLEKIKKQFDINQKG